MHSRLVRHCVHVGVAAYMAAGGGEARGECTWSSRGKLQAALPVPLSHDPSRCRLLSAHPHPSGARSVPAPSSLLGRAPLYDRSWESPPARRAGNPPPPQPPPMAAVAVTFDPSLAAYQRELGFYPRTLPWAVPEPLVHLHACARAAGAPGVSDAMTTSEQDRNCQLRSPLRY